MHSGTGTSFLQIVGVKLSTGNSKNCCPGGKLVVLHCSVQANTVNRMAGAIPFAVWLYTTVDIPQMAAPY